MKKRRKKKKEIFELPGRKEETRKVEKKKKTSRSIFMRFLHLNHFPNTPLDFVSPSFLYLSQLFYVFYEVLSILLISLSLSLPSLSFSFPERVRNNPETKWKVNRQCLEICNFRQFLHFSNLTFLTHLMTGPKYYDKKYKHFHLDKERKTFKLDNRRQIVN